MLHTWKSCLFGAYNWTKTQTILPTIQGNTQVTSRGVTWVLPSLTYIVYSVVLTENTNHCPSKAPEVLFKKLVAIKVYFLRMHFYFCLVDIAIAKLVLLLHKQQNQNSVAFLTDFCLAHAAMTLHASIKHVAINVY